MGEVPTIIGAMIAGVLLGAVAQLVTLLVRRMEQARLAEEIQQEADRVELILKIVAMTGMSYEDAQNARDNERPPR